MAEALRLADLLEDDLADYAGQSLPRISQDIADEAAAELRRLDEAHDWQHKMAGERLRRIEKLEAQRDALLEALKLARSIIGHPDDAHTQMIDAVIKAVEGEKA